MKRAASTKAARSRAAAVGVVHDGKRAALAHLDRALRALDEAAALAPDHPRLAEGRRALGLDREALAAEAKLDSSPFRVYVASSFRNKLQPEVVARLRGEGFEVYDFHDPHGDTTEPFRWFEIDGDWRSWTPEQFAHALSTPMAERGFEADFQALLACDFCVLLHPAGRSSHLEAGYAVGADKKTFVLLAPDQPPDLMLAMTDVLCTSLNALVQALHDARSEGI